MPRPPLFWIQRLLFLGLLPAGIILYTYLPSKARWSLPKEATEIQEFYMRAGFNDYCRCIKAKLPEASYHQYAQELELGSVHAPVQGQGKASHVLSKMEFSLAPAWWNPPPPDSWKTWYAIIDADAAISKKLAWHNGEVFYLEIKW